MLIEIRPKFIPGYRRYTGYKKLERELKSLLESPKYLHGELALVFREVPEAERVQFLRKLKRIIITNLFNEKFLKAIALDILKDGEIKIESNLYQYLAKYVYNGDSRSLLLALQSTLDTKGK